MQYKINKNNMDNKSFTSIRYNNPLDFSTAEQQSSIARTLIEYGRKKTYEVINLLKTNPQALEGFTFEKAPWGKGVVTLTGGLYLIVNTRTKRIYLGGSGDLAQRKGEHKQNFIKAQRQDKLNSLMREDLAHGQVNDFVFIPLVFFELKNVQGFGATSSIKRKVSQFLDLYVEKVLLEQFFNEKNLDPSLFYNQKTIGAFQVGNNYGGTPQSGSKDKAIRFENYAWESISAVAKCFSVDRKSVRNKLEKGFFSQMTEDEFEDFNGNKIFNSNASIYFNNNLEDLQNLRKKLFPRAK